MSTSVKKNAFPAAGLPKATARRAAFPKEKPCALCATRRVPSEAGWRAYTIYSIRASALARVARSR